MPDRNNSFEPSLASQTTALLLPGKLSGFQLSDRLYKKVLQDIFIGHCPMYLLFVSGCIEYAFQKR